MARIRASLVMLVVALGAIGCINGSIGEGTGGAGPSGSGADATGGGPGSGGEGAVGGGSGGGGGSDECATAADCPGLDSTCHSRSCDAGTCGFTDASAGTTCDEDGGKLCDGAGSCVECLSAGDCQGGLCQQGLCVPASCGDGQQDGDESDVDCGGSCAPCGNGLGCNAAGDCQSGFCNGGTCAPCGSNADCGGGYCNGGVCAGLKADGDVCASGGECQSGACADGVCCASACGGACMACIAGKTGAPNGTCAPVVASTDPDAECPGPSCSNGLATSESFCNGNGACSQGTTTPCGAYACGPNACLSMCNGNGDCAANYTCSGGQCTTPLLQNGAACGAPAQCASSQCVDGVCCNNACGQTCRACDNPGSVGTCSFIASNSDPDNECSGSDVCNGSGSCTPQCLGAGPQTTPLDSEEQALLVLVNQHRANNGLGPLSACTSLNRAAQGHSEDMRDQNYFSHTGLNGSLPWDRACWACYSLGCGPSTAMAENIAAGNSGAQATFTQWVNSPGHNANMLGAAYTVIGIGRATGGGMYGVYWTNVFGGASEASCN